MTKKIPNEQKVDLTDARRKRCAPVVKKLLQAMLDDELLLSDRDYVEQQVKLYLEGMFAKIVSDHFSDVMQILDESLKMTLAEAQNVLWDKDTNELKFTDLDELFKKDQVKKSE